MAELPVPGSDVPGSEKTVEDVQNKLTALSLEEKTKENPEKTNPEAESALTTKSEDISERNKEVQQENPPFELPKVLTPPTLRAIRNCLDRILPMPKYKLFEKVGKCFIINVLEFDQELGLESRAFAIKDHQKIKNAMQHLGFEVQIYGDSMKTWTRQAVVDFVKNSMIHFDFIHEQI